MSTAKSLWGELPLHDAVRTPLMILREQATILTEMTNAVLEGVVVTRKMKPQPANMPPPLFGPKPKEFTAVLNVEAPALDGYSLRILRANYNLALYPVDVFDVLGKAPIISCNTETEFVENLARILSSEPVRNAVGMLLAQSRSEQQAA